MSNLRGNLPGLCRLHSFSCESPTNESINLDVQVMKLPGSPKASGGLWDLYNQVSLGDFKPGIKEEQHIFSKQYFHECGSIFPDTKITTKDLNFFIKMCSEFRGK